MITITTNNHARPVLSGYELTAEEAKDFDYLDLEAGEGSFFRYKNAVYDLGEFMRVEPLNASLSGWGGYQPDTYFSGVLVRYVDDFEAVIIGRYYS